MRYLIFYFAFFGFLTCIYASFVPLDTLIEESNSPLTRAIIDGNTADAKRLLENRDIDPSDFSNEAIRVASKHGRIEIIEILLKDARVDPSDLNSQSLIIAIENGHADVVDVLLLDDRVNPTIYFEYPIRCAVWRGHHNIVARLLQDSRVAPVDHPFAIDRLIGMGYATITVQILRNHKLRTRISPENLRDIIRQPEIYLAEYADWICRKDGIPSYIFLNQLLVIAVTRQQSFTQKMMNLFRKNPFRKSVGDQIHDLWIKGRFVEAFALIDSLWFSWKWLIQKHQVRFRYHPNRMKEEITKWN